MKHTTFLYILPALLAMLHLALAVCSGTKQMTSSPEPVSQPKSKKTGSLNTVETVEEFCKPGQELIKLLMWKKSGRVPGITKRKKSPSQSPGGEHRRKAGGSPAVGDPKPIISAKQPEVPISASTSRSIRAPGGDTTEGQPLFQPHPFPAIGHSGRHPRSRQSSNSGSTGVQSPPSETYWSDSRLDSPSKPRGGGETPPTGQIKPKGILIPECVGRANLSEEEDDAATAYSYCTSIPKNEKPPVSPPLLAKTNPNGESGENKSHPPSVTVKETVEENEETVEVTIEEDDEMDEENKYLEQQAFLTASFGNDEIGKAGDQSGPPVIEEQSDDIKRKFYVVSPIVIFENDENKEPVNDVEERSAPAFAEEHSDRKFENGDSNEEGVMKGELEKADPSLEEKSIRMSSEQSSDIAATDVGGTGDESKTKEKIVEAIAATNVGGPGVERKTKEMIGKPQQGETSDVKQGGEDVTEVRNGSLIGAEQEIKSNQREYTPDADSKEGKPEKQGPSRVTLKKKDEITSEQPAHSQVKSKKNGEITSEQRVAKEKEEKRGPSRVISKEKAEITSDQQESKKKEKRGPSQVISKKNGEVTSEAKEKEEKRGPSRVISKNKAEITSDQREPKKEEKRSPSQAISKKNGESTSEQPLPKEQEEKKKSNSDTKEIPKGEAKAVITAEDKAKDKDPDNPDKAPIVFENKVQDKKDVPPLEGTVENEEEMEEGTIDIGLYAGIFVVILLFSGIPLCVCCCCKLRRSKRYAAWREAGSQLV